MSEILKSFLQGYNQVQSEYKDKSKEEIEAELYTCGLDFLRDTGRSHFGYTREQLIQIGFLDIGVCAERERESFNKRLHEITEQSANINGQDVGTLDRITKRGREVLEKDLLSGAKFQNFAEIFRRDEKE